MIDDEMYLTLFVDLARLVFCNTELGLCTWTGMIQEARLENVNTFTPPTEWLNTTSRRGIEWFCPVCGWKIGGFYL